MTARSTVASAVVGLIDATRVQLDATDDAHGGLAPAKTGHGVTLKL
jgi:hypothetical protein